MTRSRQDPPIPPQALSPAGSSEPTPRPPGPSANNQRAIRMVGLAVLIHMLRSRRLYERAAFAAIVLAALAGLNKDSRAKNLARLTAWAKRQDERLQRKAKAALS
jgi:hypothetical protein